MNDALWVVVVVAGVLLLLTLAVAVVLLVKTVATRRRLKAAGLPMNEFAFWGALLYLLSPVDLLPDPVYLDDIGVLLLALRSLRTAAPAGLRKSPTDPELRG
ncbi:YkvA family protein [Streptomyces sclerotialus]|uniref:YkvA family protein n=1 Tax=Streptomyces sclerotialus TaxID=1957 RepID=UPI0004C63F44